MRPLRSVRAAASRLAAHRFTPELATLVDEAPRGDEWLHEIKFDGYRIGCFVDGGECRLVSRKGNDWTSRFPTVVAAARRLRVRSALLDGEVAVVLEDGKTSFQALQNAFGAGTANDVVYFVFDLLHLDGEDLTEDPLEARKERLAALLSRASPTSRIRYSEHTVGDGPRVLDGACRLGLEGIVSKRRDLPHHDGRSRAWLKTKCVQRQEFVIGGFTEPEGSREGIGALVIGVRARSGLSFAGKVGTGFTRASARALRARLDALETKACPFSARPAGSLGRDAHWVRPELIAEVAFTEWTSDGRIRHPSFQGLREDKDAAEVVREAPARSADMEKNEVEGIRISHPERVVFPEAGVTKLALAELYAGIAERMLPHLVGRPLTLVRCPDGAGGECFYMKHSKLWAPPALRRVRIAEKKKTGDYLVADSAAALVALVQMNVLEIHTWNSTIDHVECPDRLVFDLDPGPEVAWREVVAAARHVRRSLEAIGLESFVKTTGGSGLHVVVPLRPRVEWTEGLAFSKAVAESIVRDDPDRYTTRFAKRGRERMILVDYLRNNRTNTSVAAYSTRATPNAPVSMPVRWEDLGRIDPASITIASLPARLARLRADPWKGYASVRQRIDEKLRKHLEREG